MLTQYISNIKSIDRQNVLILLLLSTFFSLGLLMFRMIYTSNSAFVFLAWNLFLAWIPYCLSFVYKIYDHQFKSRRMLFLTVMVWLPFFPNAPYILTDLFHLWDKHDIPLWFDLILILSFAWTGVLLGFTSLYDLQKIVTRRFSKFIGWSFAITAIFAGSFGIYIGRFLRWNSWDLISNPLALAKDLYDIFFFPASNTAVYGMTIFFSGFFIISYLTFQFISGKLLKASK